MTDQNETELEIFWGSGSPFAWRVLMTAEVKGVSYTSHQLQFSEKEHKAPAYLALNPRGQVPALRHGDYVLAESLAIMVYLDELFPQPPLFGRTPAETGLIWQAISEFLSYVEPVAYRIVDAVFADRVNERRQIIETTASEVHDELARLEKKLSDRPWLVGDSVSAADILAHSGLEFFLRIATRDVLGPFDLGFTELDARYPAIAVWRQRTRKIPGYDNAYPPHWRTS